MSFKLAAIGFRHNHVHDMIKGLTALGGFELAALAEDDPDLRSEAEARYGVSGYADYREMLEKEQPGVVTVTVVNSEKARAVIECLRHGTHVFSAKPLALCLQELDAIREALAGSGTLLSMNLALRFSPPYMRAKELLDEGRIGEVISCMGTASHKLLSETRKSWELDSRLNGGLLADLGVHQVDLARWLTGSEIEEIRGYRSNRRFTEIENFFDNAQVVARFRSGAVAMLAGDWLREETCESHSVHGFRIMGTRGSMEIDATKKRVILSTPGNPCEEVDVPAYERSLWTDFAQGLEGKARVITNDEVLDSTEAALQAERSARLDRMVKGGDR